MHQANRCLCARFRQHYGSPAAAWHCLQEHGGAEPAVKLGLAGGRGLQEAAAWLTPLPQCPSLCPGYALVLMQQLCGGCNTAAQQQPTTPGRRQKTERGEGQAKPEFLWQLLTGDLAQDPISPPFVSTNLSF